MLRWRAMAAADIPALLAVAAVVHTKFPEHEDVFAERLRLFPAGCRVLGDLEGRLQGYVLSHPWHAASPVPLNSMLGRLPSQPKTLYIHDLAVLPDARGSGVGAAVVREITDLAAQLGLAQLCLVAVNSSAPFWARHGFQVADSSERRQLQSYGEDAVFMVRTVTASPSTSRQPGTSSP